MNLASMHPLLRQFLRSESSLERIALSNQMESKGIIRNGRIVPPKATSPMSATKLLPHPTKAMNPNRWK